MKSLFLILGIVLARSAIPQMPTPTSADAAAATAHSNSLCTLISPFYWEIGDAMGELASGSEGTGVNATTALNIDSASKLLYATYVVELRNGKLRPSDIPFLNFTSGYMNFSDSDPAHVACPPYLRPYTVNSCLAQNVLFTQQNPSYVGIFFYNGGHMENHASGRTPLGTYPLKKLTAAIFDILDKGGAIKYVQPLISGGVRADAADYAAILRSILSGEFRMLNYLGTSPVCTVSSATCNAGASPFPYAWHYSIGHWVEDDPAGDGAFSSIGAQGFYPWISADKHFYGVLSRAKPLGWNGISSQGGASTACGQVIRKAWFTGAQQY